MPTVTLARLMKIKKRTEQQISRVSSDIIAYNSVTDGSDRDGVNIQERMEQYDRLSKRLVELKKLQAQANAKGKDFLTLFHRKNEVVGKIALLRKMNTTHGLVVNPYDERDVTYNATLRKQDVDAQVVELEGELDSLQDQIDQYNATTMVEVPGI